MTLHDRDWVDLTLKWLVITSGAFLSIVAAYLLISPDDMQHALQRTARWHCSIQASIMIDRSFYILMLVMGLRYVSRGTVHGPEAEKHKDRGARGVEHD
jgi:hypothetical protein